MKNKYEFQEIKKKNLILIFILLVCYFAAGNIISLLYTAFFGQELSVIQKEIIVWGIDIATTIILIISLKSFIAESFLDLKDKGIKSLLKWTLIGYLLQFFLSVAGYGITVAIVLISGVKLSFSNQTAITAMLGSSYILNFISMVIIAPFIEELFFRVFIFSILKNNKIILAIFLSSLLFGLGHVFREIINKEFVEAGITIITYAFSGVGLAVLYAKRKNFLVPMFVHMIWNLTSFALILLKNLII